MTERKQCPGCGAPLEAGWTHCAQCGLELKAPVESFSVFQETPQPQPITHPKTIEELGQYCAERGMPLEKMRFFIGRDYRQARAFGIYRDGDRFVVYKNKADGSRAVRYQGPDEAYAVNELFQKLLSECHNRGIYPENFGKPGGMRNRGASNAGTNGPSRASFRSRGKRKLNSKTGYMILLIIAAVMLIVGAIVSTTGNRTGYYRGASPSDIYYYRGGDWYGYRDYGDHGDWYWIGRLFSVQTDYLGPGYDSSWGTSDFFTTDYYEQIREKEVREAEERRNNDWDDDWDDWDDWGTDWDSDW